MSYKNLLLDIKNKIATVTLNRPEKMNSLDEELIKNLTTVFNELSLNTDVSVILLTGSNNNFCSGLYLDYLKKISEFSYEENLKDSLMFRDMLLSIYDCSKPVVAKVSGYALAGGCGITTCCDFIVADNSAKFGYTEVKIGFIPAIVSVFLLKRVSETYAKDLLLSSRIIDANEAFDIGLINKAVSGDSLDKEVKNIIDMLMKNSSNSIKLTKQLLRKVPYMSMEKALEYACESNAGIRMTDDCKEGISKFLNRNKK